MTTSETVLPPDDLRDLEPLKTLLPSLPPAIRKGAQAFVDALSQGEAVRVESISPMLTTSQAASILNISRMTLVKLLDAGKIPFEQPSVHRLVRLDDVLAYKRERSVKRATYFEDSMRQAEEDGTRSVDIRDYTAALKKARSRKRP